MGYLSRIGTEIVLFLYLFIMYLQLLYLFFLLNINYLCEVFMNLKYICLLMILLENGSGENLDQLLDTAEKESDTFKNQ